MSKRFPRVQIGLGTGLLVCSLAFLGASLRADDVKAPAWKHGLEFRVRKAGEADFTKDTRKYGAEAFLETNANQALYVTEAGTLAAAPPTTLTGSGEPKNPQWLYALELKVRKAGESDFTPQTRKYGIEVFRDENSANLVYISETGSVAVVRAGNTPIRGDSKAPRWLHGLELKVRKGGESDFNKDTKRYGIEVFKDENSNNLVYISETGALAVVPAGTWTPGQKPPAWLHGLEFRVRKAGESDFTTKTANFGAEVFKDENAGNLVYVTQEGFIAVVPGGTTSGGETKAPKWLAGLELKVRKAGESDFTKDTPKHGAEVFADLNTGCVVYIAETGSIAAVPGK